MKILIASDIHDDIDATELLIDIFRSENYDKMYLLGDIEGDAIELLNPYADRILAVAGNNDSYSDIERARFPMPLINYDYQFGKYIVLTHGHYYDDYTYDKPFDIMFLGHTHFGEMRRERNGSLVLNPGSISRPRDGYHSYMSMDETGVYRIDSKSGKVLDSIKF